MNSRQYRSWTDALRNGPKACWNTEKGVLGYYLLGIPAGGGRMFLGWTLQEAEEWLDATRSAVERIATEHRISRL